MCVCVSACVCVRERERECVCERERERESVCVCECVPLVPIEDKVASTRYRLKQRCVEALGTLVQKLAEPAAKQNHHGCYQPAKQ